MTNTDGIRFQSTLSLRRATAELLVIRGLFVFQSTLSLRRATSSSQRFWLSQVISIHALLAESDRYKATTRGRAAISIHALLAESDDDVGGGMIEEINFNPRSPCGERPMVFRCSMGRASFQSTLSLRRATMELCLAGEVMWISIHALLAESDRWCSAAQWAGHHFNPRSPCGERQWSCAWRGR